MSTFKRIWIEYEDEKGDIYLVPASNEEVKTILYELTDILSLQKR